MILYDTAFVNIDESTPNNLDDEIDFVRLLDETISKKFDNISRIDLSEFRTKGSRILWGYSNPFDFIMGFLFCSIIKVFDDVYISYFGTPCTEHEQTWFKQYLQSRTVEMRDVVVNTISGEEMVDV